MSDDYVIGSPRMRNTTITATVSFHAASQA